MISNHSGCQSPYINWAELSKLEDSKSRALMQLSMACSPQLSMACRLAMLLRPTVRGAAGQRSGAFSPTGTATTTTTTTTITTTNTTTATK